MIRFPCPHECGQVLLASPEMIGQRATCTHCWKSVVVPTGPVEVTYVPGMEPPADQVGISQLDPTEPLPTKRKTPAHQTADPICAAVESAMRFAGFGCAIGWMGGTILRDVQLGGRFSFVGLMFDIVSLACGFMGLIAGAIFGAGLGYLRATAVGSRRGRH